MTLLWNFWDKKFKFSGNVLENYYILEKRIMFVKQSHILHRQTRSSQLLDIPFL